MMKRDRRDRIQHVAEAKRGTVTYWLTRDRAADGALSAAVDVWLLRPERVPGADGSYYYRLSQGREVLVQTGDGPKPAHHGIWSLDHCLRECRTYPDDDRQVIVVGDPSTEPPLFVEEVVS